ncbi:M3 family metallopeptidase [Aliidiomarina indica]|uniref:M3 family metallopeptidase n=1 Tax=Aliidiomarina indica TaxID=2749147 RepID=UPI00188EF9EB|nr:M3 family metallopeptidase [Aliidiomarina indica]
MRITLLAAAVGLALSVTACSDAPVTPDSQQDTPATIQLSADNPFFAPSPLQYQAPDFTQIRDEHYAPAFEAGMSQQAAEMQAIANNPEAPSFENTVLAMELSGELLTRVSRVFFAMTSSTSNDEIRNLQAQLAPKLSAHRDDIYLNPALFLRVDTLYQDRHNLDLDAESLRLLEVYHDRFIRAGANLSNEQMAQIRALNEEESSLTTQFARNILDASRNAAVIVDSAEELDGFSESQLRAARQRAEELGHEGKYAIAITNTTRQPILTSINNRELRQRVWEASANRGFGHDPETDNTGVVSRLAQLRAEKSAILGYESYAHYALEERMIGTPERAYEMLLDMVPAVVAQVEQEQALLEAKIAELGYDHNLEPWDWAYYAEKVRRSEYDLDESEVRPYFEFNRVLEDGMFYAMTRLYGITFEPRPDLPSYHDDVDVYEVFDKDGESMGIFYADYFARDGKRGGAWMSSFVIQNHLREERPVVFNVMNIPKAPEGEPTLLSYGFVSTMFHEMGHGVHGLFSDVTYPSLAGTAVPRDFVESPSNFHEDFAHDPAIIGNYAKHYETGEPIPEELLERVLNALNFNQGFDTLEYIAAALVDLDWHSIAAGEPLQDVAAFEAAALERHGVNLSAVPPRFRSTYFSHIFAGGYAAGYYSYMWSEMLAADAFAYLMAEGGIDGPVAQKYRDTILSRGGTKEAMELYLDFRGQEYDTRHLLIRRGLLDADD